VNTQVGAIFAVLPADLVRVDILQPVGIVIIIIDVGVHITLLDRGGVISGEVDVACANDLFVMT
jgi:hypothetical protein